MSDPPPAPYLSGFRRPPPPIPSYPQIAEYQPFAELARGAAVVYKAYDRAERRTVLLKVLAPEAAADPALVAWFEGEARAVAAIEHPNVVGLYAVGRHGGQPYLAAEFVEGRSLEAVLGEGPLPPELAAYVAAEAARGLAAAHQRGLLHRDVKPANVLLGADGRVKLADFGLATRVAVGDDGVAGAGADVRGTPGYLAPETVRGEPAGVGADLFALGAVLVEMLTGRPAFPAVDAPAALDAALHHDPLPALTADPRVPAGIAGVAGRLLAKRPAARLASADAAADALDAHRAGPGADGPVGAEALAAYLDDPEAYRASIRALIPPPVSGGAEVLETPTRPTRARRVHVLRRIPAAAAVLSGVAVPLLLGLWIVRTAPEPPAPSPSEPARRVEASAPPAGAVPAPPPAPDSARDSARDSSVTAAPALLVPPVAPGEAPPAARDALPAPLPPSEPSPSPAPAPAAGALAVAVEPWADVTVDGAPVGRTPLGQPLALAAGEHRVVLRHPDFPPYEAVVAIAPGAEERLRVSLWSLVARVTLEVHPWAEVAVDGQPWGTVPPQRRPLVLAPGTHTLRLTHPALGTREETVTVSAGETRTLRFRLDRPPGGG